MLASGLRSNRIRGGLKAFSGSQHFYSAPLVVKSFCMRCLCLCMCQSLFAPSPSLPLGWSWLASQKFPLKFSMFRCLVDAAHRVIMVTLTLACGSLGLLRHRSPHPSIGDGFKTTKTNKEKSRTSVMFSSLAWADASSFVSKIQFHGDHSSYLFHRTRIRSNRSSWALSTIWLFQMFSTR